MEGQAAKRKELRNKIYMLAGVKLAEEKERAAMWEDAVIEDCAKASETEAYGKMEVSEQEYLDQLRTFLLGQDFMRLGHCIQGGRWNLVLNNSRKLKEKCAELGITCFDRYLEGLRGAARGKNTNEAVQVMSKITEKRVQLRNLLTEERELCGM